MANASPAGTDGRPGAGGPGAAGSVVADLLIVGGGVNGAGIARDAVGRGMSVVLCEQGDLAGATSSASTKLIHGGLRYLEYYEFRLVREALQEREVLLRAAPHIIWPLRFVLPHDSSMRPAWMVRIGLFLYDHLGKRKLLPGSHGVDLTSAPAGKPLSGGFTKAFEYSDCWVEDSRLVVLNAMDAKARGAEILTRTRCEKAERRDGLWEATLVDVATGATRTVRARALVNAAGPWVREMIAKRTGVTVDKSVRLVKGSHIVVRKMFEGEHAYIFQNDDRRIVFAIPYERDFTLIGTTDLDYSGDPGAVAIAPDEIAYMCRAVSRYFAKPVSESDVVWTYSGVRPLFDDASGNASAVTRDYVLEMDEPAGQAPMLSIFGGKITTFRRLAEEATEKLGRALGKDGATWTANVPLPGGDIADADFAGFLAGLKRRRPWLPDALALRLARAYGTRVERLLGAAQGLDDLGIDFGGGVFEAELDYAAREEFAMTGDDFLWRRSKLGLHLDAAIRDAIGGWFDRRREATANRDTGENPGLRSMGGMR
ncbi:glycerol-3-phosphate dehydrogenase (plasmid) [Azospirillum oryzae]|uniref:Glycerol-3-phosphate dehydrogenase n=1 Tax=Azospirillum oryzae TaxID=286727 RepID=A0A6N1APG5_9PROT|nr:glycerol-3-phosphate dehydrogenase [Azospirillum oryzae]KAA0585012.1 glycerol-3-phosphate dehydrogenase [Azospirillum oryzae]QKS53379.1 glycerol-3-phosphate dehydrogenase [Azospirillum oryzae]